MAKLMPQGTLRTGRALGNCRVPIWLFGLGRAFRPRIKSGLCAQVLGTGQGLPIIAFGNEDGPLIFTRRKGLDETLSAGRNLLNFD